MFVYIFYAIGIIFAVLSLVVVLVKQDKLNNLEERKKVEESLLRKVGIMSMLSVSFLAAALATHILF